MISENKKNLITIKSISKIFFSGFLMLTITILTETSQEMLNMNETSSLDRFKQKRPSPDLF